MVKPWPDRKPCLWFHSDSYIPDCDCGEREWQIDLPDGFMWLKMRGPGEVVDMEHWPDVIEYANSLHPNHPDIVRIERYARGGYIPADGRHLIVSESPPPYVIPRSALTPGRVID